MSGNAALAAAKRRRNPIEPPKPEQKKEPTKIVDLSGKVDKIAQAKKPEEMN